MIEFVKDKIMKIRLLLTVIEFFEA
jgi:hypothetical protein